MPVIEGFDLRPPLKDTPGDDAERGGFLTCNKQHFVFWPNEHVQPMTDRVAFNLPDGTVLKLPKDGTKFRSSRGYRRDHAAGAKVRFIRVWHGARSTIELACPSGRMYPVRRNRKSIYSAKTVAKNLEGVDSTIIVDWAEYGGEPNATKWKEMYASAHHAWISAKSRNEERIDLLKKEYFTKRIEAKKRAWPVLKTLRLCRQFGNSGVTTIGKLPVELLGIIEGEVVCLKGAPAWFDSMVQSYEAISKDLKQVKRS
ncbi:hypothetical protein LTR37_018010 [Vermiconidia calcicola]|uniref:Uncharacterized protein n=1 Tax=Vermiconidia calcicola TaxID=1690605 RepID=A0ACC3MID4_9PEZI|nr:hypothetical protein LTR37_018010 [Vermiconidia calcicola]